MSIQIQGVSLESIPLACNVPEVALAARKQELRSTLFANVVEKIALADGYEFRFSAEFPLESLFDYIQNERACCGFFTFELIVTPLQTALRLRGGVEIKAFIEQMFLD